MAILMMLKVPGGTVEQYERTNEILGIAGDDDAPEGLIYHVAARSDDGIVIADVWRSEADLERFFERAGAALAEAGVPETQPRIAQVHNHIPDTTGKEPGVLAIIEVDGLGTDAYDQMAAGMEAHTTGNHSAVAHIAAVKEDGSVMVVDVWESPEAFAAFAESQIAPAGETVGLGPVEPRFAAVHNTIRGAA